MVPIWGDVFRNDAIIKGEEALKIFKHLDHSQEYAECLSSLAYCYSISDDCTNINSEKSVKYCLEALEYFCPLNHGELYVSTLSHLSGAYVSVGKYQKAIETADSCIAYSDSCLKEQEKQTVLYAKYSDAYSLALHNKAIALYFQGRFLDCLMCNKQNLQFRLNTWGRGDRYAISAYNLAIVEMEFGLYVDAHDHFVTAFYTFYEINRLPLDEEIKLRCHMLDCEIRLGQLFNARPNYSSIATIANDFDFTQNPQLYGLLLTTTIKYWLHVEDLGAVNHYIEKAIDSNLWHYIDDDILTYSLINDGYNKLAAHKIANNNQKFYESEYGKNNIISINNLPNVIKSAMAIDNWNLADSCANRYVYGMRKHIGKIFPVMTSENRELLGHCQTSVEKLNG